ncbi:hypothetical protein FIL93_00045 [SAR202 cluster bacterium AD-493-K16_JPT_193m]|nr:hypothetical protein [SAR202 cluster bacterium AD-493-K16_JPT_193m]
MIPRSKAIEIILEQLDDETAVLSTTGMITREVYAAKDRPGNFYMIGSMGLTSSVALGISLLNPNRETIILEGDGSALMGMGTIALIASETPTNLIHIILDNESYESTGAQPTISSKISLDDIASAAGYQSVHRVDDAEGIKTELAVCRTSPGPHFILVKCSIAPVPGIGRVDISPVEIRDRFSTHIR